MTLEEMINLGREYIGKRGVMTEVDFNRASQFLKNENLKLLLDAAERSIELQGSVNIYMRNSATDHERYVKLEAENKLLREGLEKYADKGWWNLKGDIGFKFPGENSSGQECWLRDEDLARDVLEKLK